MTAELLDRDAPDEEDMVICWLQPLVRSATERGTKDPLPFCTVTRISGADDPDTGVDDPVVQVDVYATGASRGAATVAAKTVAKQVHRRMMLLARQLGTVTLSDHSVAAADYVETVLKPFRMDFDADLIVRYTARYRLGLHYVTA